MDAQTERAAAPEPHGRLEDCGAYRRLVIERELSHESEAVWGALTCPDELREWIGTWWGTPGAGKTVMFQMTAEGESTEPVEALIEECLPAESLRVTFASDRVVWRVGVELVANGAAHTHLRFVMRVHDDEVVSDIGPGWEYYLDRLAAALAGAPMPDWEDYYPAQCSYYESLQPIVVHEPFVPAAHGPGPEHLPQPGDAGSRRTA